MAGWRSRGKRTPAGLQSDLCGTRVALALGSNLGEPEGSILGAVRALRAILEDLRVAPLYRSQPVSALPQSPFVNTAVLGRARLTPEELLGVTKMLEWRFGRRRGPRHGPRTLDIDLLLYGDLVLTAPQLTVPHPALRQRLFVLRPLCDLAPELPVPPDGRSVAELLGELPPDTDLEEVSTASGPVAARPGID